MEQSGPSVIPSKDCCRRAQPVCTADSAGSACLVFLYSTVVQVVSYCTTSLLMRYISVLQYGVSSRTILLDVRRAETVQAVLPLERSETKSSVTVGGSDCGKCSIPRVRGGPWPT